MPKTYQREKNNLLAPCFAVGLIESSLPCNCSFYLDLDLHFDSVVVAEITNAWEAVYSRGEKNNRSLEAWRPRANLEMHSNNLTRIWNALGGIRETRWDGGWNGSSSSSWPALFLIPPFKLSHFILQLLPLNFRISYCNLCAFTFLVCLYFLSVVSC